MLRHSIHDRCHQIRRRPRRALPGHRQRQRAASRFAPPNPQQRLSVARESATRLSFRGKWVRGLDAPQTTPGDRNDRELSTDPPHHASTTSGAPNSVRYRVRFLLSEPGADVEHGASRTSNDMFGARNDYFSARSTFVCAPSFFGPRGQPAPERFRRTQRSRPSLPAPRPDRRGTNPAVPATCRSFVQPRSRSSVTGERPSCWSPSSCGPWRAALCGNPWGGS